MFELGQIVITQGIKQALKETLFNKNDLLRCLILHSKNISDSCDEDKKSNLDDIKNNYGCVLNKYIIYNEFEIFINTHLDNYNKTTIMFTHEY